jgi:hypothetical protein
MSEQEPGLVRRGLRGLGRLARAAWRPVRGVAGYVYDIAPAPVQNVVDSIGSGARNIGQRAVNIYTGVTGFNASRRHRENFNAQPVENVDAAIDSIAGANSGLTTPHVMIAADLSSLTYLTQEQFAQDRRLQELREQGYTVTVVPENNIDHHDRRIAAIVIERPASGSRPAQTFVAVRGSLVDEQTDQMNRSDHHTNMNYELANLSHLGLNGQGHQGFEHRRQQLIHSLQPHLDRAAAQGSQVVFTGHSQGAGVATLLTAQYAEAHLNHNASLITFGGPRVGDETFARQLRTQLQTQSGGSRHLRFVHAGDPITGIPPRAAGYSMETRPIFISSTATGRTQLSVGSLVDVETLGVAAASLASGPRPLHHRDIAYLIPLNEAERHSPSASAELARQEAAREAVRVTARQGQQQQPTKQAAPVQQQQPTPRPNDHLLPVGVAANRNRLDKLMREAAERAARAAPPTTFPPLPPPAATPTKAAPTPVAPAPAAAATPQPRQPQGPAPAPVAVRPAPTAAPAAREPQQPRTTATNGMTDPDEIDLVELVVQRVTAENAGRPAAAVETAVNTAVREVRGNIETNSAMTMDGGHSFVIAELQREQGLKAARVVTQVVGQGVQVVEDIGRRVVDLAAPDLNKLKGALGSLNLGSLLQTPQDHSAGQTGTMSAPTLAGGPNTTTKGTGIA